MNKLQEMLKKVYEVAKNSNKTAKIVSFFVGFCFNLLGIILVAVWKLIFSKDEVKNKYCIRLSVLGCITKVLVFSKILSVLLLLNPFGDNIFAEKGWKVKHKYHKPVHISVFNDFGNGFDKKFDDRFDKEFNKEFARMHRRMNRMFEEQQRIFNEMFEENIEEQKMIEREFDKLEKINQQDVKVKKEVKNENGFETTTIKKTSPNAYSQQTTIKYVGDNNNKSQERFNSSKEVSKLQPVNSHNNKQNNRSDKHSKSKNQK